MANKRIPARKQHMLLKHLCNRPVNQHDTPRSMMRQQRRAYVFSWLAPRKSRNKDNARASWQSGLNAGRPPLHSLGIQHVHCILSGNSVGSSDQLWTCRRSSPFVFDWTAYCWTIYNVRCAGTGAVLSWWSSIVFRCVATSALCCPTVGRSLFFVVRVFRLIVYNKLFIDFRSVRDARTVARNHMFLPWWWWWHAIATTFAFTRTLGWNVTNCTQSPSNVSKSKLMMRCMECDSIGGMPPSNKPLIWLPTLCIPYNC